MQYIGRAVGKRRFRIEANATCGAARVGGATTAARMNRPRKSRLSGGFFDVIALEQRVHLLDQNGEAAHGRISRCHGWREIFHADDSLISRPAKGQFGKSLSDNAYMIRHRDRYQYRFTDSSVISTMHSNIR
jgi:hypothetical protein